MSLVEEIRSSWLILLFGCILYTGGMCVLFWNEGRAVHITLSLGEALEDTVTIDPYAEPEENAIYDNRIVHFTGPLLIGEPLTEPDYNIHIMAVKLKRRVQMFQWVEESVETNFGGSVSSEDNNERNYYYYQDWRDKLIDHRRFYIQTGHHNPDKFPVESQTQIADLVKIGQFEIGLESKKKIEEYTEFTSDTRPEEPEIKLHMGFYYHTNDVFNPEIGDLRILFSFAGMEGEVYTVVGKLHQNRLVPYQTRQGKKILLVYKGEVSLSEVFRREHHAQRMKTWGFRFMGWVLMFFSTTCLSSVLRILFSRVEVLSRFFPESHSVSTNMIFSFSLALIITGVAWAFHRPWICAGMLFAAASPFLYCTRGIASYNRLG